MIHLAAYRQLLSEVEPVWRRHRTLLLTLAGGFALAALLLHRWDAAVDDSVATHRIADLRTLARMIRDWGRAADAVFFIGITYLLGWMLRRTDWKQAARAALLSLLVTSIIANVIRFSVARPRPRALEEANGSRFSYATLSFPSGHSAASWSTASALLVAAPAVGIPAALSASAVAGASVYQRSHYLSDVVAGSGLGILFGFVFGFAARRLRPAPGQDPQRHPGTSRCVETFDVTNG